MAANANNDQTIGSGNTDLFSSSARGGSQIRGALAISIYNGDAAETLLVRANWHGAAEFMPIPPTGSLTLEVEPGELEITHVEAKRAGAVDVTGVGWGVTMKGKGSQGLS